MHQVSVTYCEKYEVNQANIVNIYEFQGSNICSLDKTLHQNTGTVPNVHAHFYHLTSL